MDYYLNNNLLDQARCLLSKIAGTECSSGRDYAALEWLDNQLPENERPKRPSHQSIDAGLQKYDKHIPLLELLAKLQFIPDQTLSY